MSSECVVFCTAEQPSVGSKAYIMKTCLYTENFTTKNENENYQIKNIDIFHISAQNIDCGYSLEPPTRWF